MTNQQSMIFVIEDDEETRKATELLLSVSGFKTSCFDSAEALLDCAVAMENLADSAAACVLADLRLPGMNGLQLFQRLRQAEICHPVIMISGHADNESIDQAINAGVDDFLLKPMRPDKLIATLQTATRRDAVA